VINNTVTGSKAETAAKGKAAQFKGSKFPEQVTYPDISSVQATPLEPAYPPPPSRRDATPEGQEDVPLPIKDSGFNDLAQQVKFYSQLAETFSNLLKTCNAKLLVNLIDTSGKIIVDTMSLCKLIGLITHEDPSSVMITYESSAGEGCRASINPIAKIKAIKINCCDFSLRYNEHFNILSDIYAVSLKKVFLSE
jgi:hypothetical protein